MLKKDFYLHSQTTNGAKSNAISPNNNNSQQQCITDEFYKACVCGDFESAMAFIKMGVNLNVRYLIDKRLCKIFV